MDRRRGRRTLAAVLTAAGVGAGLALALCRGWPRRPRARRPAARAQKAASAGIPQPIGTPEMGAMPEMDGR